MRRDEARPAGPARGPAVRAAPGRLVLARGPAAGPRLPARGPRLPRRLLRGRRGPDVGARPPRLAEAAGGRGGGPRARRRRAQVIPAAIVFAYLAIVVYIGVFAFRH